MNIHLWIFPTLALINIAQSTKYGIPNFDVNEYSTTDTYNFGVDKYYVVKKKTYVIPDSSVNE